MALPAVHIVKEDTAQPQAWARNARPPSGGGAWGEETRQVSERVWGVLKGSGPLGVLGAWREKRAGGDHLLLRGSALAMPSFPVHKRLQGLWVGSRGRRAPSGSRALGRRLRIPFMPLGAAGLAVETRGGRAGLPGSAAQRAASGRVRGSVRAQTGAGGGDPRRRGDCE